MQKEVKTLHSSEFIKDGVEHNKNQELPDIGDTSVHEERANVVKQFNQYRDSHLNNRLLNRLLTIIMLPDLILLHIDEFGKINA
jgi:hypothetical protein